MTLTADPPASPAPGPAHRVGRRDRLRLELWLWRLGCAMEDYPRRAAREVRRDLRASALDEAARVGMAAALHDLGRPSRLAAAYFAELDRPRPRWADGAVLTGLVAVIVPGYMWLAWQLGVLDALDAMGGGSVELSWLGVPAVFTHTEDTISMETTVGWGPIALTVALGAAVFALGSRIWRLWGTAA